MTLVATILHALPSMQLMAGGIEKHRLIPTELLHLYRLLLHPLAMSELRGDRAQSTETGDLGKIHPGCARKHHGKTIRYATFG